MTTRFTRRALLRAALAAPALAVACKTTQARPLRDATPAVADDDPPDCSSPTEDNIEGPFFKAGAPHRAVLADKDDQGTRLEVGGVVTDTNCRPLAGVELEIWHADASGAYDLRGYKFRGALTTNARGEWHVSTIVPGRYLNGDRYRPAHLHFKLHKKDIAPLTTQLYFPGDPYNEGDPFIKRSLIMQIRDRSGGKDGRFDFVLAGMPAHA